VHFVVLLDEAPPGHDEPGGIVVDVVAVLEQSVGEPDQERDVDAVDGAEQKLQVRRFIANVKVAVSGQMMRPAVCGLSSR
jgi:hypothetical protein